MTTKDYYRKEAERIYTLPGQQETRHSDHIVFLNPDSDRPGQVTECPGEGAYVQAWVWVSTPKEEEQYA